MKRVEFPLALLGDPDGEHQEGYASNMISVTQADVIELERLLANKGTDDVVIWKKRQVLVSFGVYLLEYLKGGFNRGE